MNFIEEIEFVKDGNNLFTYCLNNILSKYSDCSDNEVLDYIKKDGNLINKYSENNVIEIIDILEDEIRRNENVLKKAKMFRDNLK